MLYRIIIPEPPIPWPKKEHAVIRKGNRNIITTYERDYRTRTNPITGEVEKYDKGYVDAYKKRLIARVAEVIQVRVPKPHPVKVYCTFWINPPKTKKLPEPTTRPDGDNYQYLIHNVLEGVAYDDDSQIIAWSGSKKWASRFCCPCTLILIDTCGYGQEELQLKKEDGD